MYSKNLFQISIIILAFFVAVFYIPSRVDVLRDQEEQVAKFTRTAEQATQLNSLLESHLSGINGLSSVDLSRLEKFLPSKIDPVSVARDLNYLALMNSVRIRTLTVGEIAETGVAGQDYEASDSTLNYNVASRTFTLHISGLYSNFKSFLQDLEKNSYPFRVSSLEITSEPAQYDPITGVLLRSASEKFVLELETYSFNLE